MVSNNYVTDPGACGCTFASDAICCVQHPYVKLEFGPDNTATKVTTCCPLPIDIRANQIDLMLGTDFSCVFGTSSLVLATQGDDVGNTSDGIQTTSFLYGFDGTAWDRLRGDSTNGLLVNLGCNNDITVCGTVTVTGDCAGSLTVDNPGLTELAAAINSCRVDVTLGSGSTGPNKAEDTAHSTGDVGVMALAVRDDCPASTGAANDYVPLLVDSVGRLHVNMVHDASAIMYKGAKYTVTHKNINHSCSTFDIVAGACVGACQSALLLGMMMVSTGAVNMHLTDSCACPANLLGDSTNVIELTCSSGFTLPFSPVGWVKSTGGDGITMNLSSCCVPVAGVAITAIVCG